MSTFFEVNTAMEKYFRQKFEQAWYGLYPFSKVTIVDDRAFECVYQMLVEIFYKGNSYNYRFGIAYEYLLALSEPEYVFAIDGLIKSIIENVSAKFNNDIRLSLLSDNQEVREDEGGKEDE